MGSPPRMRGTAKKTVSIVDTVRITPAHAGNSNAPRLHTHHIRDHPRACGEQPPASIPLLFVPGSPPRMRGTVLSMTLEFLLWRITPAHAGNSLFYTSSIFCPGDHPRACGEQKLFYTSAVSIVGSPPRMRGTESMQLLLFAHPGITPAHAGNSD